MTKTKKISTIKVQEREISVYSKSEQDYISLMDIARYRDANRSNYFLPNWLRKRSTIEVIGLWEQMNNPGFNCTEFGTIKNDISL